VSGVAARGRRGLPRDRVVVAGVGLLAFVARLPALGRPGHLVFDELFYAPDAASLLRWGQEQGPAAHPPLGKWAIATGIATFGFDPVGWRMASVAAGALLCALVAWTAIRITGRAAWGVVGGVLAAVDGLVHVTSRLALLDVFLALATTATIAALIGAWTAQDDHRRWRRCWWLAVAALSAGVAVKWSAGALLPLVAAVGWTLHRRPRPEVHPRWRSVAVGAAGLVLGPLLVVVLASAPRQLGPNPVDPGGFVREQREAFEYHRDLRPTNRNAAWAGTWVFQTHPVVLARSGCVGVDLGSCPDDARVASVLAAGNPIVWLAGVASALGLGVVVVRRRGHDGMAVILLGGLVSLWGPWLLSPRKSYAFYGVAIVPLLVLATVVALDRLPARVARAGAALLVVAAVAGFVLWWPVWSGQPMSPATHRVLTSWPGWR
jgi:dolichyl-phosphate-mannose-protein mannosyltransferase